MVHLQAQKFHVQVSMSFFPAADIGDDAAEALQRQADIFRQKPLSAEEQEHVKRGGPNHHECPQSGATTFCCLASVLSPPHLPCHSSFPDVSCTIRPGLSAPQGFLPSRLLLPAA